MQNASMMLPDIIDDKSLCALNWLWPQKFPSEPSKGLRWIEDSYQSQVLLQGGLKYLLLWWKVVATKSKNKLK